MDKLIARTSRPISILSIFWRAWSAAWVKCDRFTHFISSHLPVGLTFAAKGSFGTECLAALIDHELSRLGYGASLDFSSCFDLVDLCLLLDTLLEALPSGLKGWLRLLIGHWQCLQRWVSTSGHVLDRPIRTDIGIPQGDAASPIILAIFLWEGFCKVRSALQLAGGTFFLAVYMDDRTVVAERPDLVEVAISAWYDFARKRNLVENEMKLQRVALHPPRPEGYHATMEVLGVTVGCEDPLGLCVDAKQQQRIDQACDLVRRVALLPEARWQRLDDIHRLVRGVYSYGWIATRPSQTLRKCLGNAFAQAFGKLHYGAPSLKRMLLFVHLDVCEVTVVNQVRLLARRQQAIQSLSIAWAPCSLDFMVQQGLSDLGWIYNAGRWHFQGFHFALDQCCSFYEWGLISHWIRESIRRKYYASLFTLKRHEFVGQDIPPYNADRLTLVRKWIKGDTVACLLATGAIASSAARNLGQPLVQVPCPSCGELNSGWDHYWRCWLHMEPPQEVLFRRFLWPRAEHDVATCNQFKLWAASLVENHVKASKMLDNN